LIAGQKRTNCFAEEFMSTKTALLDSLMEKYGYDAIAMIPSPNMSWLTGQAKSQGERPTTIIYRPGKTAALIIAGFEVDAAPAMDIPVEIFRFTDVPSEWGDAFRKAADYLELSGKKIAVEPNHFRFLEHQFILNAAPGCTICGGPELFTELRLHKSEEELGYMRQAAIIAQDALEETLKMVKLYTVNDVIFASAEFYFAGKKALAYQIKMALNGVIAAKVSYRKMEK
jgi:Xaa-Pro dipeptidase